MATRELTPADYIAMLRRRWVLIVVLAVIGSPLAYTVSRFLPNKFKSQTLVIIEQPSVPQKIVESLDTSDINQRLSSMQQQILSRSRLEPIIRQFNVYPEDVNRLSMYELVSRLQKTIDITPIAPMTETRAGQLPGFYVAVTLDDAHHAQEVCTAITSMFIEQNLRLRQEHSEMTTQFLATELTSAKANLDEQDAKLAEFKSRHIGELPEDEQTNLNLLTGLTSQLDASTQALARAQQDKSFNESLLSQQESAWQSSQTGRNPETLEQQLIALQAYLTKLQSSYTDDYPDVIKAKNDIAVLQKKIADSDGPNKAGAPNKGLKTSTEPAQIQQLRAQLHNDDLMIAAKTKEQEQIRKQIDLYQARVQSSPAVEQQYKELTRGYQTALDSYNDLQKKLTDSQQAVNLERKQEGEQFVVLDPANLPDKPTFPNRPMFALGGLAGGLGLGLGIAFLLEMKDSSFKTERDVEFALHLPVLAMVPEIIPASEKKQTMTTNRNTADSELEVEARA
ncbi:MAG TPA: Wzz/FepE/Etk N-terminal domain-containing protein [Candidatus Acidoferrum sp.]|nr:Wzz/FepE/Etk N-terminal domain-containing protein [Candidatus Acidoferrum sp.]